MSSRTFDPLRLDVGVFAAEHGELHGEWPLHGLQRLAASGLAASAPGDVPLAEGGHVVWHARGEQTPRSGGLDTWLHLAAQADVVVECQRCLSPLTLPLEVRRRLLFVQGEDAAAQIDASSEDDVLAMTRALDLRELVEDELLLAMPLVPLHEVCPEPLSLPVEAELVAEQPHPFAALAALKQKGSSN